MRFAPFAALVLLFVAISAPAWAEDAYYAVPLSELEVTEGELPSGDVPVAGPSEDSLLYPFVVVEGAGEGYVSLTSNVGAFRAAERRQEEEVDIDVDVAEDAEETDDVQEAADEQERVEPPHVAVRAPQGKKIAGRLFLPNAERTSMTVVRFEIQASAAKSTVKNNFYLLKERHYEALLGHNLPGAGWFRYQVRAARDVHGEERLDNARRFGLRERTDQLSDTFALFTGGRAMSENLQLDRVLPLAEGDQPSLTNLEELEGITVAEIDWAPLIKDLKPRPDPLAMLIPHDQHAVFFPTFAAATRMADEFKLQGTIILGLSDVRSEDARTFERYQKQLGITFDGLDRLAGEQLVQSVALTGSDPYLRTGADVALLLQSGQASALRRLLLARATAAASKVADAKPAKGTTESGLKYEGFVSPDREISTYFAELPEAVVVTNSLEQLERLATTRGGDAKNLASLPEYAFFRNRYPRDRKQETAFVFLSDATIRRWASPRWRIATSRRTRAAAVMAQLQAEHLEKLVSGKAKAGPLTTDLPTVDLGDFQLTREGVRSTLWNDQRFMTPIAEVEMQFVTAAEADAYRNWREGYQSNWSWAFDPIGLSIELDGDRLAADLTVMPLIAGTEYRQMIDLSQGVQLEGVKAVPDALFQAVLSVNRESELFAYTDQARLLPGLRFGPLGWLGDWAGVYVESDPFWQELAQIEADDARTKFLMENERRIPVAVQAQVADGVKLAAMLTALDAMVQRSAPNLARWESLLHNETPYVRISSDELIFGTDGLTICYTTINGVFTVSPSEELIKRWIDREMNAAEAEGENAETETQAETQAWSGQNLGVRVDHRLLRMLAAAQADEFQNHMQQRSWSNLPILNEWKRLFPDKDPLDIHETYWQTRPVCPGGGEYVWNDEWQTMESTLYGHPAQPKQGPAVPPALTSLTGADFGLTFEEQGLRARAELSRQPAAK